MYDKGSNLLHTLRQIIDDDEKWRQILRGLNRDFYHQTVSTAQIENYISEKMEIDLKPFFNQYLRDIRIPVLEYVLKNKVLKFRWINIVDNFEMPIELVIDENSKRIFPSKEWKEFDLGTNDFYFDNNYYFNTKFLKNSL